MDTAEPVRHSRSTVHERTILVVEDEIFVRCAIGDHLRTCGLHVIEAANATEAIRVLASGTDVDLVFSDIHKPAAVDGIDLAQWIAAAHPDVKVILASAQAGRDCSAPACCAVLSKPFDPCDLEARIRTLLDQAVPVALPH